MSTWVNCQSYCVYYLFHTFRSYRGFASKIVLCKEILFIIFQDSRCITYFVFVLWCFTVNCWLKTAHIRSCFSTVFLGTLFHPTKAILLILKLVQKSLRSDVILPWYTRNCFDCKQPMRKISSASDYCILSLFLDRSRSLQRYALLSKTNTCNSISEVKLSLWATEPKNATLQSDYTTS